MKPKPLETRFPTGRIKKVMQADDEVGKVAVASPVLISRALELFLQKLVDETYKVTIARNAKTVTGSHLKACIEANSDFDFLREVVAQVPDLGNELKEEKGPGRPRKRKDEEEGADEEAGASNEGKACKLPRRGKADGSGALKRQTSRKKKKDGQVEGERRVEVQNSFDLNSQPVDTARDEVEGNGSAARSAAESDLQNQLLEKAIQEHQRAPAAGAQTLDGVDDDYDDM
ncbi:hypothetical protein KFL_002600090 [Klebsormidium nitens]|uniref:Transcription factor CBF/NF-Y/archaeal histone domain-containing protein n=1 Tax=Klebsormidium nitens TaxID=105231 RepID=A0A1Y1I9U9_KLENI|nr:hypothetical protein KFL_002600090 [Klebsormidium nitens]|eukprot:GAQ85901.1 hypothetical protein KFL_002600090 [Klebsormidium nitens]